MQVQKHVEYQKQQKEGKTLVGSGRKITIGEEKGKQLADCIKAMCNWAPVPCYTRPEELCKSMLNQTN